MAPSYVLQIFSQSSEIPLLQTLESVKFGDSSFLILCWISIIELGIKYFQIALSLICNRPKFRLSHLHCTKRTENVPDVPKTYHMYQNHNELWFYSRGDVSYGCCWFLISSMTEFPTRLLFIPVSLLTLQY